jgi:hypothetical protein
LVVGVGGGGGGRLKTCCCRAQNSISDPRVLAARRLSSPISWGWAGGLALVDRRLVRYRL